MMNSRSCKLFSSLCFLQHSEENNLHEREYNMRKDLNLRIVLTKNVMQSFFGTKLSEKMQ